MRRAVLAAFVLLSLVDARPAHAQSPGYDAAPLLESLRPSERARAPRQAGRAADLPLYDLTLDLADDLRSFTLDELVTFPNRSGRAVSSVVLRVFVNAVSPTPQVELASGACLDGARCRVSAPSPSAIVVELARPIPDGASVRIRLQLRGRFRSIDPDRTTLMGQSLEGLSALSGGHGAGDYGLLAHSDGVASMASFFPVLARMRAGLWEQSDASTMGDLGSDALANVRARVRTGAGVHVVASGLEDAPVARGGRLEHSIRAAFVRDFAVVASSRLRHRERDVDGVRVRSFFVDGHEEAGAEVLDAAAHAMRTFTRRFGPYPYTELDVVEAPLVGGAGGVEFTGMVTVANMFFRPVNAGEEGLLSALGGTGVDLEARRRSMLEFVTAHEVGHQWWHGIVGSDSREHPFQDEGLAQYAAMLYMEDRHGVARARREAESQVAGSYHMMRMLGRPDAAVDQPVHRFGDSMSYGGIVYGKGPYLYRALRQLLGDRRFFSALRAHVAEYRFRIAPPRALFERMARGRRGPRVRALVRRWLEETHGDEDLGEPDLGRMLGGTAGTNDPQTQALMRMLGRMMGGGGGSAGQDEATRGLLRILDGAGAGGGTGGDPQDAQDAMRTLRRLLEQQE